MYSRVEAAETRREVLLDAIRTMRFGTLILVDDAGRPQVASIPFVLKQDGDDAWLEGHVARANQIWKLFPRAGLVLFQGPQAYVRPGWYATKKEHGKVVPTWAYVMIEARGGIEIINEMPSVLQHLGELTDQLEGGQREPWSVDDAPEGFISALARGVVAIRIPLDEVSGVWKLNQHRSEADQAGMIEGFNDRDDAASKALADIMRQPRMPG
jgi:transcriptional regulator